MRGEYYDAKGKFVGLPELPPRARRIQKATTAAFRNYGTTSACAENTPPLPDASVAPRNYLRVRGEYLRSSSITQYFSELPPRARRILPHSATVPIRWGTTSACAENTIHWPAAPRARGNYLRVRGEYLLEQLFERAEVELPPRARRIPRIVWKASLMLGTTSACAENTA